MENCRWIKGGYDYMWYCPKETTYKEMKTKPESKGNFWSAVWCALGSGAYNWNTGVCNWEHITESWQIKRWR